ncbi:MAG: hypothetical protein AAGF11_14030 [Myxococcota bacterium]
MTRASFVFAGLALSLGLSAPTWAAEPDVAPTVEPAPAPAPASPTTSPTTSKADEDPGTSRTLKVGAALTGVGAGLGIAAGVLTHVALTPPCQGIDDILQCEVPTAGGLLGRHAMIGTAGTFAIGGAILGGLGGGRLARGLALDATDVNRERRQKIVTGVGAGTLSLGLAQAIAGVTMMSVGIGGAIESVDLTDGSSEQDDRQREQINDRLRDVKVARSGLAMLLVSPTFIATGAAMLLRRKAFEQRRVEVSFAASPTDVGVVFRGRF